MTHMLISLVIIALAIIASSDAGTASALRSDIAKMLSADVSRLQQPAHTPTPTPTATATPASDQTSGRVYLNKVIPPCTLITKPGVDPCEFRPHASVYSIDRGIYGSANLYMRHRDLLDLSVEFSDTSYIAATHIVLRGTGMPGTARCENAVLKSHIGIVRTDDQKLDSPAASKKGAISCYMDFSVQEYIIGKGSPSLTLMVYTLAVPIRFETYAEYERFIRPQLEREYAGREYVLYVAPSPYYDVETLDIVGSWDVQRNPSSYYSSDERKTVLARLYAHIGEQIDHMICSGMLCAVGTVVTEVIDLSEFVQSTKEHHKRLVEKYDGRVRPEPVYADLISDVYDLKLFFEQVGAYNIDGFTPAQPPPIPGENDPYTPGTNVDDPTASSATVTVPGASDDTPTDTPTPTPTATTTPAPLPSDTPTPMPTSTSTPAPLPTDTPIPIPISTPAPLPADTPTPAPTATSTLAPLPTDTPTAVPAAAPTETDYMQSYSCFYPHAGPCRACYAIHNCRYQQ